MRADCSLLKLKDYCEREGFAGWDPYDGLNSKLLGAVPLIGRSALVRLAWIQLFKRNPLNLRRLLMVPKQRNAKGVALFLKGYCALWRAVAADAELTRLYGSCDSLKVTIEDLADWLVDNRAKDCSGSGWGYNFPWQCRREFLFPAGEPTVVATYFCATALFDAFDITGNNVYRDVALAASSFVKNDLRRTPCGDGVILSYSRLPGNDTIYNASLLGSALLARCYSYGGDESDLTLARESVIACCSAQADDGSWTYGVKPVTGWIDSFHTGYNLMALAEYMRFSGDCRPRQSLNRGLDYYLKTFFKPDGTVWYYHDRQYPVDIHCVGQLPVTLLACGCYRDHRALVCRVMEQAEKTMFDKRGFYYYQLKKGVSSKISYMRWSNAFMFASLSLMAEADAKQPHHTR